MEFIKVIFQVIDGKVSGVEQVAYLEGNGLYNDSGDQLCTLRVVDIEEDK